MTSQPVHLYSRYYKGWLGHAQSSELYHIGHDWDEIITKCILTNFMILIYSASLVQYNLWPVLETQVSASCDCVTHITSGLYCLCYA